MHSEPSGHRVKPIHPCQLMQLYPSTMYDNCMNVVKCQMKKLAAGEELHVQYMYSTCTWTIINREVLHHAEPNIVVTVLSHVTKCTGSDWLKVMWSALNARSDWLKVMWSALIYRIWLAGGHVISCRRRQYLWAYIYMYNVYTEIKMTTETKRCQPPAFPSQHGKSFQHGTCKWNNRRY